MSTERNRGGLPIDRAVSGDGLADRVRGRWAPTPSGLLHLGSARTALVTWLSVRSQGGCLIWRLEDLDPPRTVVGTAEAAMQDLAWLGLDWDEGPSLGAFTSPGGDAGPYCQSQRGPFFEEALGLLATAGRLFPCRRSRKDLQSLATAPHDRPPVDGAAVVASGMPPYPAAWRPKDLAADWYRPFAAGEKVDAALRFRVAVGETAFDDSVYGLIRQDVAREVGDVVLKRRDGFYAYQLAVVVDDLAMQISEVIRGVDLMASTPRQIQLIEALGGRPPSYVHLPLMLNADGAKLSKRDGALTLRSLRETGVQAEQVVGYLAYSLGWQDSPRPMNPRQLMDGFSLDGLSRDDWVVPAGLVETLKLESLKP